MTGPVMRTGRLSEYLTACELPTQMPRRRGRAGPRGRTSRGGWPLAELLARARPAGRCRRARTANAAGGGGGGASKASRESSKHREACTARRGTRHVRSPCRSLVPVSFSRVRHPRRRRPRPDRRRSRAASAARFATMLGPAAARPSASPSGGTAGSRAIASSPRSSTGSRARARDVVDVGVGPTPMLYVSVHALGTDGRRDDHREPQPGRRERLQDDARQGELLRRRHPGACARSSRRSASLARGPRHGRARRHARQATSTMVTARIRLARTDLKFVLDAGNGAGGPLGARVHAQARALARPALLRDGRPLPEPSPRPDRAGEPRRARRARRGRRARASGIAYDGDADRLGAVDANGEIVWGDKLMILFSRALLAEQAGRGHPRRGEVLADALRRHREARRAAHHVEDGPLAHQDEDEGGGRAARRRDERPPLLRRPLLRLRRRDLRVAAPARDPREAIRARSREMLADVPRTFATPEIRVDCPDALKFDVVAAVREHYRRAGSPSSTSTARASSFGTERDPAWGLVRASNTGPVLVMRFEADEPGAARRDPRRGRGRRRARRARTPRDGMSSAPRARDRSGPSSRCCAGRRTTSARAASRTRASTRRSCSARALGDDAHPAHRRREAAARRRTSSRASASW